MSDTISKDQRSANMRAVRSGNTLPEMHVRRIAYALGYRFRLHRRDLPGTPDLAFPGLRKVIFVHGCFWHQHRHCRRATVPRSNVTFWRSKLAGNRARDVKQLAEVRRRGWRALVIWECQTKDEKRLAARLSRFLVNDANAREVHNVTKASRSRKSQPRDVSFHTRKTKRLNPLAALRKASGAWKDEDHPELEDGAARRVSHMRKESEKRLPRAGRR